MTRLPLAASATVLAAALSAPAACAETVRVFAAASLTEAFGEMKARYEKQHAGDDVELNLAGSQILRTQIEQGAPADVFASADLVHSDALKRAGLLGPNTVFARNRVVVVVPVGSSKVGGLPDLARRGVKILVAGAAVPVGRYTTQVLEKLAGSGLYGDAFESRVRANVVSEETSVRAVLSKVALGEADAGFVYVTDAATAMPKLRSIEIPERYNVVAEYPIAVLTRSGVARRAQAFVELVLGPEGQAILRKYGFVR